MFVYRCWVADMDGNPTKKQYQVPADPRVWPTRPSTGLVISLETPPEDLIRMAEWYGWGYNPHTRTFYRLD
jgi:hypothetical protein